MNEEQTVVGIAFLVFGISLFSSSFFSFPASFPEEARTVIGFGGIPIAILGALVLSNFVNLDGTGGKKLF